MSVVLARKRVDERSLRLWTVAAFVVAAVLRLVWAMVATRTPGAPLSDMSQFLRLAMDFSHGRPMTLGGRPTAWFSPGYPLILVPAMWGARAGWWSAEFGASFVNVVAGTITVWATSRLARLWIGPRAALISAWVMALAVGQILYVSVALSETVSTCLVMVALVLMSEPRQKAMTNDRRVRASNIAMDVAIGVVVMAACLVRAQSLGLILVPLAVAAARRQPVRTAIQQLVVVVGVVGVAALGSAVQNHKSIGSFSPNFTGAASFFCMGHFDGSNGLFSDDPKLLQRCFGGSPFDNRSLYRPDTELMTERHGEIALTEISDTPSDEGGWSSRVTRQAVSWALRHPLSEVGMTLNKTLEITIHDDDALDAATDFSTQEVVSQGWWQLLGRLANLWQWLVVIACAVSLSRSKRARRAVPLVWMLTWLMVSIWAGLAFDRYHHSMMPIAVALGSAALVPLRPQSERGVDDAGGVHVVPS